MKYYLVFDNNHNFRGLLPKEYLELFKVQRNMKNFHIYKMKKSEIEEKFGRGPFYKEAVLVYGFVLFPDEEEFLFMSFDQMHMDFRAILANFLREIKPFVKFTDEEFEKVEGFLQIVYSILEEADVLYLDEDECFDFERFYKMDKLVKIIVDSFGGR
jgi:hypothetical protein